MKVYNIQSDNQLSPLLLQKLDMLRQKRAFDEKMYIEQKCKILNNYLAKCKLSACVVAVSGGIDSAVVLALVHKASQMPNSPKLMGEPGIRELGVTGQSKKILVLIFITSKF